MKKFFKTKFKKIISIFTAIVVLTLVLIIPVSAVGQNLFNGTWEQGLLRGDGLVNSTYSNFITSSSLVLSAGVYKISVPSDFQVGYLLSGPYGEFLSNNFDYSSNNIEFTSPPGNCSVRICLRRTNNAALSPSQAPDVSLVLLNYVNYTELDIDQFNFTIPSISTSYGSVEPTQHESGYNLWYTSLDDINPISFSDIGSFNWYVSLSANSQLQEGYYTFSLSPVFLFDSNISSDVGSAKVTLTLGSDEKVVVSQTVAGSKVSSFGNPNSVKYDLQYSIYYDPEIHQQLFNDFTLTFNFLNSSVSGNLYYIGFNTAPKLLAPDSYPSFDSSSIDDTMQEEADILDRFTNDFNGVMDSLENSVWGFLGGNQQSIFAFRRIADNFFDKPWVADILSISIICGILPFLGRVFIRRKKD